MKPSAKAAGFFLLVGQQRELAEVFETGRDAIERAASDKFDRTSRRPYEVVTVTADDLGLDHV